MTGGVVALNGSPVLLVLTLTSNIREAGCGMSKFAPFVEKADVGEKHMFRTCIAIKNVSLFGGYLQGTERRRVLTVFIQTVGDQGHLPHAVVRLYTH